MMTQLYAAGIFVLGIVIAITVVATVHLMPQRRIARLINAQGGSVQCISGGSWHEVTFFDCRGNLMTGLAKDDSLAGVTWRNVRTVINVEDLG